MSDLKRLLIISHTRHYWCRDQLVGWGPTVREIDMLAKLFSEVVHLAPIYTETPPESALSYRAANVRVRGVRPSGGKTILAKAGIFLQMPKYWRAIDAELQLADAVHVRCPANISLLAIVWLAMVQRPHIRWVKYAGNWRPTQPDHLSYAFQRWWLQKGWHKGVVTVNGRWPDQPEHIYSFYNPSLTRLELLAGKQKAKSKKLQLPLNLLFVGRVEEKKGVGRAIQICRLLHDQRISCRLNIVGDGPQADQYKQEVTDQKMTSYVHFHGWIAKDDIAEFYANSDFLLLPTATEGWPKVLSEGMAYGVVPVVGAVSSIPQLLAEFETGVAIDPYDIQQFTEAIKEYVQEPSRWQRHSRAGLEAASHFAFSSYLEDVCDMFKNAWQVDLGPGMNL